MRIKIHNNRWYFKIFLFISIYRTNIRTKGWVSAKWQVTYPGRTTQHNKRLKTMKNK